MRKCPLILVSLIILVGCSPIYKATKPNMPVKQINLNTYKIYQFTMYRDLTSKHDKLINPSFTTQSTNKTIAHEILYLLTDTLTNNVIYITTDSHSYLYRNRHVFNSPIYKNHLIFNDLDYVYLGKETGGKFSFYNPKGISYAQNLHLYYTKHKNRIQIDSVTNNYAVEEDRKLNPYVTLGKPNDVFGITIDFTLVKKKFGYNTPINRNKRLNEVAEVSFLIIQDDNVYLKLKDSTLTKKPFFKNALKYIAPY